MYVLQRSWSRKESRNKLRRMERIISQFFFNICLCLAGKKAASCCPVRCSSLFQWAFLVLLLPLPPQEMRTNISEFHCDTEHRKQHVRQSHKPLSGKNATLVPSLNKIRENAKRKGKTWTIPPKNLSRAC